MALTWSWKEKRGQIFYRHNHYDENDNVVMKECEANIYEGNAPLIALDEWKEGGEYWHAPYLFFCDDTHAKKCLGIISGNDGTKRNLYDKIYKIRISRKHRNFKKIVKWFMDAFDDIVIDIYDEKEEESNA